MASDWDSLQELAKAEMRKVYSETVIDYATNPRNLGRLDDADGFARVTGSCGDTMEMWLKVRDNTVTGATFLTDGCATTVVAGGMTTELAKGKSRKQPLANTKWSASASFPEAAPCTPQNKRLCHH